MAKQSGKRGIEPEFRIRNNKIKEEENGRVERWEKSLEICCV
jgi:hypothetical protein